VRRPLAIALTLLAALLLVACGSKDEKKPAPAAKPQAAKPAGGTSASGCTSVEAPAPKPDGTEKKPSKPLDDSKTWTLEFKTNCGSFTVQLDLKKGPNASASLVQLANSGFFEGTIFHRIVPDFVIQGGDPTGSGNGGAGYTTIDKPPSDARYTKGVVAMAKAPNEPAGAASSQFYVVTGEDAGLPPDYAIVGKVTKGLDVVEKIGTLGDANEQPTELVVLESVTAKSS
jgi:cyclophilin family peptidyl-prolyl cis-trans isomerase